MENGTGAAAIRALASSLAGSEDALISTVLTQLAGHVMASAESLSVSEEAAATLTTASEAIVEKAPLFFSCFFIPLFEHWRAERRAAAADQRSSHPNDACRLPFQAAAVTLLEKTARHAATRDPRAWEATWAVQAPLWCSLAAATHSFSIACRGASTALHLCLTAAVAPAGLPQSLESSCRRAAQRLVGLWLEYFAAYNRAAGGDARLTEPQWLFLSALIQKALAANRGRQRGGGAVELCLQHITTCLGDVCQHAIHSVLASQRCARPVVWGLNLPCRSPLLWELAELARGTAPHVREVLTRMASTATTAAATTAAARTEQEEEDYFCRLAAVCSRLTKCCAPQEEAYMASTLPGGFTASDNTARFWESVRADYARYTSIFTRGVQGEDYISDDKPLPKTAASPALPLGVKRPHSEMGASLGSPLQCYMGGRFLTYFHPTCFDMLGNTKQPQLSAALDELAALLVHTPAEWKGEGKSLTDGKQMVAEGVKDIAASNNDADKSDEDEDWVSSSSSTCSSPPMPAAAPAAETSQPTAVTASPPNEMLVARAAIVEALRRDERLCMLLVHAVGTLLKRRSRVSSRAASALERCVLPALVALFPSEECRRCHVDDGDSTVWWPNAAAAHCAFALITSGVLAAPWNCESMHMALARYGNINAELAASGCTLRESLDQLVALLAEGAVPGGGAAADAAVAAAPVTDVHPEELDEAFRLVTPIQLPAPCDALLVAAAADVLARRLFTLRLEWEQADEAADGGAAGYVPSSDGVFCAASDVETTSVLLSVVGRAVFAFAPPRAGLLRHWVAHLAHLFTTAVPPEDRNTRRVHLPPGRGAVNCFGEPVPADGGWRAAGVEDASPVAALRRALGTRLAELALLPCADVNVLGECPVALPASHHTSNTAEHLLQRARAETPLAVLVTVAFFVGLPEDGDATDDVVSTVSAQLPHSFLGLWGFVAFLRTLEEGMAPNLPDSPFRCDARFERVLRQLWRVADVAVS